MSTTRIIPLTSISFEVGAQVTPSPDIHPHRSASPCSRSRRSCASPTESGAHGPRPHRGEAEGEGVAGSGAGVGDTSPRSRCTLILPMPVCGNSLPRWAECRRGASRGLPSSVRPVAFSGPKSPPTFRGRAACASGEVRSSGLCRLRLTAPGSCESATSRATTNARCAASRGIVPPRGAAGRPHWIDSRALLCVPVVRRCSRSSRRSPSR